MGGIEQLAETVATDREQRLPGQRKTQRGKLALLGATMLEVRSANLMDVAACLPRPAELERHEFFRLTRGRQGGGTRQPLFRLPQQCDVTMVGDEGKVVVCTGAQGAAQ